MKLRIQAQHLQPGDIVGSGETIKYCGFGARTPNGQVEIWLTNKYGHDRQSFWKKYTMINVERVEK